MHFIPVLSKFNVLAKYE